jgi:DNA invertase Pin-like site-specific DNA recombinase
MTKVVRCAIYTRKSTEEGLDQAFNSLHAQREACEAYVKSQIGEGWKASPTLYDDGGFSGGSLDRPALAKLLAEVDAGRVDIVVVYKVDRLTRSLADFAKIVERLDGAGASFVSVTQAFNTTTSMGRLTLNVLLSFAQFEREVTGERIRDKIAASKAKGMWMGGILPLGYDKPTDSATRALVVNPEEARTVERIFRTYLEVGSVHTLEARLAEDGVRSKARRSRRGDLTGGGKLARGALFHVLKNRVYLGEIPHRDVTYRGNHPAIIEREGFDEVQAVLGSHRREWRERPLRSADMVLKGKLFGADGEPMSPSFTHRGEAKVYRYYVSAPLQQGRAMKATPGAVRRVAADEIESLLEREMRARLGAGEDKPLRDLLAGVKRVDLEPEAVRITCTHSKLTRTALAGAEPHPSDPALAIVVLPVRCRLRAGRTRIVAPVGPETVVQTRRDPALIRGLQQAHRTMAAIGWRADGSVADGKAMAVPTNPYQRKLCRLALLAPDIQQRILDGRQPRDLTLDFLIRASIPTAWPAQRIAFGFVDRP